MTIALLIISIILQCFISTTLYLYLIIPAEKRKREKELEQIKKSWENARLIIKKPM